MKQKWLLDLLTGWDRKQLFIGFWIVMAVLFAFIFYREQKKIDRRNFRDKDR